MEETLLHHLGKTAEILVFLIGAMTIVEIVDYFNGFSVFQKIINFKTKKQSYGYLVDWHLFFLQ